MNPVELEDQISTTDDNDEIINPDSASSQEWSSNTRFEEFDFTNCGMMRVEEGNIEYESIKQMFLPGLGPYAANTDIVAVHKTQKSASSTIKARWDSFRIFSDAVAKQRGGNANVKFAWYGGSKDEIRRIISQGFAMSFKPAKSVSYGVGVCLHNSKLPFYGMESAELDRDGMRHMLLCRVILGNSEVVQPGSKQFHPSSEQFDSGVDNLKSPNRFIIWSPFMNSHVFPHYVVSFKASSFMAPAQTPQTYSFRQGPCRTTASGKPNSPWISFPDLLSKISKFLNPTKIALVSKHYSEYRANKISRAQLIRVVRQIIGDNLLIRIIKAHKEKVGNVRT